MGGDGIMVKEGENGESMMFLDSAQKLASTVVAAATGLYMMM